MESYCCLLLVTAQTSCALSSFLWLIYLPAAGRKLLPEKLSDVLFNTCGPFNDAVLTCSFEH